MWSWSRYFRLPQQAPKRSITCCSRDSALGRLHCQHLAHASQLATDHYNRLKS